MPNHTDPGVIITDQDAAIARAISIVLSSTLHRFCLSHILTKFSEKMNVVLYNDQYHRLAGIIKQSESPTEFEQRWTEVMETTELGNNEWLTSMYEIRSRWVPGYVKHVFAVSMVSSQRSESGHSFLKKYVDKKNSLTNFVSRFNRALVHQRHTELAANHIDISQKPRVKSTFIMENQMVQVYTKKIILLFQKEIEQSNFYMCSKRSSSDEVKVYAIQRLEPNRTFDRHRQVTYFPSIDYISCSCQMFEFEGYPCRHMICYMKKKQVMFLPKKYILHKWTKNAKQATVFDPIAGSYVDNGPGQSLMSRHGILSHAASVLVDDVVLTDVQSTFLLNEFQSLHIRLKEIDNSGDVSMSKNRSQSREETQEIYDLNPVRAKGSGKRLKGGKEKALSQSNNRQCSACHTSGHDRRTCPMVQNRLVNVNCHASNSQYSYHVPEDDYMITGSSNFEAAPSFFHNHYQFP